MKQVLLLFVVLSCTLTVCAQQIQTATPQLSKADYLLKSKRARTTGFVLAGVGLATFATGAFIAAKGATEESASALTCVFTFGFACPEVEDAKRKQRTGNAIFLAGLGTAAASIPFFISGAKHKKKANTMSFRIMEPVFVDGIVFQQSHPYSLKLIIGIK